MLKTKSAVGISVLMLVLKFIIYQLNFCITIKIRFVPFYVAELCKKLSSKVFKIIKNFMEGKI